MREETGPRGREDEKRVRRSPERLKKAEDGQRKLRGDEERVVQAAELRGCAAKEILAAEISKAKLTTLEAELHTAQRAEEESARNRKVEADADRMGRDFYEKRMSERAAARKEYQRGREAIEQDEEFVEKTRSQLLELTNVGEL